MTSVSSPAELAAALSARGLLPASGESSPTSPVSRPWFVSALLGAAGWLAGVFALIFVYLLFEPQTTAGFGLAGLIMLAAAYGLYFTDRSSAFFDQLALSLSIAGQLSLTWAAADATRSTAATASLVAILQLVLLVSLPNRLARTLAAFFACVAWAIALRFAWWDRSPLSSVQGTVPLLPALLGWAVIWLPVAAGAHLLLAREARWLATRWREIARPALNGSIAALAIATWASQPFASLPFLSRAAGANWLALWPLLSVGTALFAALCAFRVRGRALLGLAIAGALLHTVQFYFVLGTTLLLKSAIMIAVGIALLAAAWHFDRSSSR